MPCSSKKKEEETERTEERKEWTGSGHWILLLLLPLLSVPLVSEARALLMELRLASEGMASLRGGILSLIRSKPLASSKLVILCCGENPLIAKQKTIKKKKNWVSQKTTKGTALAPGDVRDFAVRDGDPLVENSAGVWAQHNGLLTIPADNQGLENSQCLLPTKTSSSC